MNRPITVVGIILAVLAGFFYFLHIIPEAVMPMFILGVIVALVGFFMGR